MAQITEEQRATLSDLAKGRVKELINGFSGDHFLFANGRKRDGSISSHPV